MKTTKPTRQIIMFLRKSRWLISLALFSIIGVCGCVTTDPVLRSAMAEAEKNPTTGRVKIRPFAEQGQEKAIAAICVAYGRSIDTYVREKERKEAFVWCSQAANAGVLEAQYHLGRFYQLGTGVEIDRALALRWFTIAAERGHGGAEDIRRGMLGLPAICKNWITNCRMF